jgi:hypothetical protein
MRLPAGRYLVAFGNSFRGLRGPGEGMAVEEGRQERQCEGLMLTIRDLLRMAIVLCTPLLNGVAGISRPWRSVLEAEFAYGVTSLAALRQHAASARQECQDGQEQQRRVRSRALPCECGQ